ncbi:MAG: hypothetical protein Q7R30_22720 [Acidobacteriota bacterium]|nr:hypothetical protein [Acidobacteriota bacterium]
MSELVHQEAAAGDREEAGRRGEIMNGLVSLALTPGVRDLAAALVDRRIVPVAAAADAAHIALAAVHGIDYLMTWNLRHIANAQMRFRIERACLDAGYAAPVICTPEELLETP